MYLIVAIAPVLVPTNFPDDMSSQPPPLDDCPTIVPGNVNMPLSPSDSTTSSSYGAVCSPTSVSCSEMDQGSEQGSVDGSPMVSSTDSADSSDMCLVAYTEPEAWCTLHYYELNTRVSYLVL